MKSRGTKRLQSRRDINRVPHPSDDHQARPYPAPGSGRRSKGLKDRTASFSSASSTSAANSNGKTRRPSSRPSEPPLRVARTFIFSLKFHSAHQNRTEVEGLLRAIAPDQNIVVSDLLTPAALQSLLNSPDCLVSAHRAEGFGLNIAEYMRDGKPVIATSYSGNTDFTLEGCSLPLRYDLIRIGQASFPY